MNATSLSAPAILIRLDERHDVSLRASLRNWSPTVTPDGKLRVVVVVWADQLERHHHEFVGVLRAQVDEMICVARQRPGVPVGDPVVSGTSVLTFDVVATLWIGDSDGVSMRMDSMAAHRASAEALGSDRPPLEVLLDIVRTPEVFDRVIVEAGSLPQRIACPGLQVAANGVSDGVLDDACAVAARRVAGTRRDDADVVGPELENSALLFGRLDGQADGVVEPRSWLADLAMQARTRCGVRDESLRRLRRLDGLFLPDRLLHRRIAEAGEALDVYTAAVVDLVHEGEQIMRDTGQQPDFAHLGVVTETDRELDRGAVLQHLDDAVRRGLGRQPLRDLATWLMAVADRAVPLNAAAYLDRLAEVRLPARHRTGRRPVFTLPAAPPGVLAPVALAGALAAVGEPYGRFAGPVTAALWIALAALAHARRPVPDGTSRRAPALGVWLLPQGLAALCGVVAGLLLAGLLPAQPAVAALGPVVAVVVLVVTLHRWWAGAAEPWSLAVRARDPVTVQRQVDQVLAEVAILEWSFGETRMYFSDAARAMARVLHRAADTLDGFAGDLRPPGGAQSRARTSGLPAVVAEDLTEAVVEALRPVWVAVRGGDLDGLDVTLHDGLVVLLHDYTRHLHNEGVHQRPAFYPRERSRLELHEADGVWGRPGTLRELLAAPVDGPLVQMCGDGDAKVLDRRGGGIRVVRFAPSSVVQMIVAEQHRWGRVPAARTATVTTSQRLNEVTWSGNGRLAGLLRLVPLRQGTVVLTWPRSDNVADDEDDGPLEQSPPLHGRRTPDGTEPRSSESPHGGAR